MNLLKRHFSCAFLFLLPELFLANLLYSPSAEGSDLSSGIIWHKEYEEALKESQNSKNPIIIYFHGEEKSSWNVRSKQEILHSKSFREFTQNHFVYLEVNDPKKTFSSGCVENQSSYLKEIFSVNQTPCLVMINSKKQELLRLSFDNIISSKQLADHLLKVKKQATILEKEVANVHNLSYVQLQKLYILAQELGQKEMVTQILDVGLRTDTVFFLLEKFKALVDQEAVQSEECLLIKKALEKDIEAFFTAALIEFQELSKQAKDKDIDLAVIVNPLNDYLEKFGDSDLEKKWRIEMILAQFYVEFDLWNSALEHAEIAFSAAPKDVKQEISRSLEYIRLNA